MTLDDLIAKLKTLPPKLRLRNGFTRPHSWRGDYSELAFEPVTNVTIGDMLKDAQSAIGATFEGYKGGGFTMDGDTMCHLAHIGTIGETLGPRLLDYMLADKVELRRSLKQPNTSNAVMHAQNLDLHGGLFGIRLVEGGGPRGMFELYLEDDENYFLKLTANCFWLSDLISVAEKAKAVFASIDQK